MIDTRMIYNKKLLLIPLLILLILLILSIVARFEGVGNRSAILAQCPAIHNIIADYWNTGLDKTFHIFVFE